MSDHAASGAPACAAPDPNPRKPRLTLPPLACDSHAHILGPASRYPYSPARTYTPPDALLPAYEHLLKTLGVARAVLVQPSVYGSDNTAMLDAMKAAGNRFRGVAVVKEDIPEAELRDLHDAGIRGVRFNIVDVKDGKRGTLPLDGPKRLAQRVRPFGWHVEFLMHVDEFPDLDRAFADFPVDIVLGHLGYMKTDKGLNASGYQAMLRLVKSGRCWVKLTGPYRISTTALPYPDVVPFAHALVKANPERILWGSDWPHVTTKVMPNDGDLCDLLSDWIPSPEVREQVLVKNPAKLYGFN
jgi:predicted TIM-barrel fold metal-dependent hydrolase